MPTDPPQVTEWRRFRRKPATVQARRNEGPPYYVHCLGYDWVCPTGCYEVEEATGSVVMTPQDFQATYEEDG